MLILWSEGVFMFRNTVLYHRLWYIKRRNAKRINVISSIMLIFIILSLFAGYAEKSIMPYLIDASENRIKTAVTSTAAAEMNRIFNENLKYEDVVHIERNSRGEIKSVDTNVALLNKLSAGVSQDILQQLSRMDKIDMKIPVGILLGKGIFAAEGPSLSIRVIPYKDAGVDFISDFTYAGANQTRHRISLQIKSMIGLALPIVEKRHELIITIPVIDAVIMGRLPDDYTKG